MNNEVVSEYGSVRAAQLSGQIQRKRLTSDAICRDDGDDGSPVLVSPHTKNPKLHHSQVKPRLL